MGTDLAEAARLVDAHGRAIIARLTDPDAGLLHYSTAGALARAHPDKYVIERTGRGRVIRRVTQAKRPPAGQIILSAEVLQAIASWAQAGPDMDTVTITEEEDGSYRLAQGDEYAQFGTNGETL